MAPPGCGASRLYGLSCRRALPGGPARHRDCPGPETEPEPTGRPWPQNCHSEERSDEESSGGFLGWSQEPPHLTPRITRGDIVQRAFGARPNRAAVARWFLWQVENQGLPSRYRAGAGRRSFAAALLLGIGLVGRRKAVCLRRRMGYNGKLTWWNLSLHRPISSS
jgi:hypothetical protein